MHAWANFLLLIKVLLGYPEYDSDSDQFSDLSTFRATETVEEAIPTLHLQTDSSANA